MSNDSCRVAMSNKWSKHSFTVLPTWTRLHCVWHPEVDAQMQFKNLTSLSTMQRLTRRNMHSILYKG